MWLSSQGASCPLRNEIPLNVSCCQVSGREDKAFPKGVNGIRESGLTERKSALVRPRAVAECLTWIERRVEFEHHLASVP